MLTSVVAVGNKPPHQLELTDQLLLKPNPVPTLAVFPLAYEKPAAFPPKYILTFKGGGQMDVISGL